MMIRIKQLIKELLFLLRNRKKIILLIKNDRKNYVNTSMGRNSNIHKSSVIENIKGEIEIGENFKLGLGANLLPYDGFIKIGDNSLVNNYSIIYGHGGVEIGNNTQIAAHCTIIPANHNYSFLNIPIQLQGESRRGIKIGDNVWVGANSVILDGVKIGNGCIIGASSVVTKSIPENCVAFGNPAVVIRKRDDFVLEKDLKKINMSIIDFIYRKEKKTHKDTIGKILSFDSNLVKFIAKEERAFPGDENFMKTGYSHTMLKRYFFAGKVFCENKKVLDSCCGIGWGSTILSCYSKTVTSFDIEKEAIDFSKRFWNLKNVNFIQGDALDVSFLQEEKFDVVTAFETIEHFTKLDGEKYMIEMGKVLKDGGVLIGTSSFPETDEQAKKLRLTNPYHLHIFTETELKKILESIFKEFHVINKWMFIAIK
ncbi:methyltransferase domain-containing protein [uncultured Lutibacter sp.]|uniref:methyltransferase domain-containing protein n=1 Tax=uncultured Lutibacter sp. TaxID=437739 RepID=UPI0026220A1C|nr:methyltransferase domain-containing protein [uncultured Lutibacter sp.]